LVAVDQQKRGVRHIDVIGGQVLRSQQSLDLVKRYGRHKLLTQRAAHRAIVQGNDLHGAQLHAAKTH
jgi:hypothetical protein